MLHRLVSLVKAVAWIQYIHGIWGNVKILENKVVWFCERCVCLGNVPLGNSINKLSEFLSVTLKVHVCPSGRFLLQ